ncbi:MAG: SIMPL domain-containing protein [Actinomycetes bacterium]
MPRGITVLGTGTAAATPDVLRLELGAEVLGQNPQQALAAASRALDLMRAELAGAGVAGSDLTSRSISLWPRHEEHGKLAGYAADLRMSARLRELTEAGTLISRVVAAGGEPARLHGLSFEHSEPAGLVAAARAAAWRDAEASARQYAELSGQPLGDVLGIAESPGAGPIRPVLLRGGMGAAAEAVPIEPGETEVTVRVEVRYAFAGARDSDS